MGVRFGLVWSLVGVKARQCAHLKVTHELDIYKLELAKVFPILALASSSAMDLYRLCGARKCRQALLDFSAVQIGVCFSSGCHSSWRERVYVMLFWCCVSTRGGVFRLH